VALLGRRRGLVIEGKRPLLVDGTLSALFADDIPPNLGTAGSSLSLPHCLLEARSVGGAQRGLRVLGPALAAGIEGRSPARPRRSVGNSGPGPISRHDPTKFSLSEKNVSHEPQPRLEPRPDPATATSALSLNAGNQRQARHKQAALRTTPTSPLAVQSAHTWQ
jgi:hypothetical protein